MKNKYANAGKILPGYVLELVRRHFPSGMLWIPSGTGPANRKTAIIELYGLGYSVCDIARKVSCSPRWVRQTLHNVYGSELPAQEQQMDDSIFENLSIDLESNE